MNEIELKELVINIQSVLDEIRPYLQIDGCDVEFVRIENEGKTICVRLLGNCHDCPLSLMTLRGGIEKFIKQVSPNSRVESV